ncbi:MAG: Na+/H+ antiporter subunit E [Thiobacillus sp.]|nr:Na+/H+ antiporter subunit E [Thiobacillus sp.]
MTRTRAILLLLANLLKELALSGWSTARVILTPRGQVQPGFARLAYGDLGPAASSLLGVLVTLTPGTTSLDIDTERHEILLHLLDSRQAEATLAAIERDFVRPLRVLFGATA